MELPRIISTDDHVVEPSNVWTDHLPRLYRDGAPHVVRLRGYVENVKEIDASTPAPLIEDESAPWADCWVYEDLRAPFLMFGSVAANEHRVDNDFRRPVTYEDLRPGCYDRSARLADMDLNHTEASLCFPTFARFGGQTFLGRKNEALALACIQAYNDWMIDEWCAEDALGRLIPLTLVPLWDPDLSAAEVRRCAKKGSHAVSFTENPVELGLPSVHSGHSDNFVAACDETDTVVNIHIGSSLNMATTGPGAPYPIVHALEFQGCMYAAMDWLTSGLFQRYGNVRLALSEGQIGWLPFVLEQLDKGWQYGLERELIRQNATGVYPNAPSTNVEGRLYGCIYDDLFGLKSGALGENQVMFEVDYPHGNSTWPRSMSVVEDLITAAELNNEESWKFVRGNAIRCFGLDRFGLTI